MARVSCIEFVISHDDEKRACTEPKGRGAVTITGQSAVDINASIHYASPPPRGMTVTAGELYQAVNAMKFKENGMRFLITLVLILLGAS